MVFKSMLCEMNTTADSPSGRCWSSVRPAGGDGHVDGAVEELTSKVAYQYAELVQRSAHWTSVPVP